MGITEATVVHHAALVLAALWAAASAGWAHPALFLAALVYLFAVNERYTMRLRKRLQHEEREKANQRRLLSDAETVRWLNYTVEKIWPVCLERVASQQFLLPIFPWFINKFKPWTARKADIQNLYLGNWFTIDEKPPIAHAKVEILEGADMKPSDPNGLSDPYVKGHLGPYRFQTKIHKKTLNPKWQEQFKIPITSWESLNVLSLQVRDKDHIFDDALGDCSVSINKLRGGQRHDIWIALKHIKTGRIHIAVTVLEDENEKVPDVRDDQCGTPKEGKASTPRSSISSKTNTESASSVEYRKMSDEYEPVDIEGLDKADVWVHRPGSDVTATWEPRKGRVRCQDSQILRENDACSDSPRSSMSSQTSNSSTEEPASGKAHRHLHRVKRGLVKLAGAMRHKSPKNGSDDETPRCEVSRQNIQPVGESRVSVTYVVDEDAENNRTEQRPDGHYSSPERGEVDSPTKRRLRNKAVRMVKHAGKIPAQGLKSMFSRKGLDKSKEDGCRDDEEDDLDEMRADSPAHDSIVSDASEPIGDSSEKAQ